MTRKYPKESWISPNVEIRNSLLGGKGMFAKSQIKEGEVVAIWGGIYVRSKIFAAKAKAKGKLVMQLDENIFSIEKRGEDPSYFMNHSCNPNVWMKGAFTLTARRDVKAGEELTADYALWIDDENYVSSWTCICGSHLCRKKITGKDWQLPELQKKYDGHFSPFINKLIRARSKK